MNATRKQANGVQEKEWYLKSEFAEKLISLKSFKEGSPSWKEVILELQQRLRTILAVSPSGRLSFLQGHYIRKISDAIGRLTNGIEPNSSNILDVEWLVNNIIRLTLYTSGLESSEAITQVSKGFFDLLREERMKLRGKKVTKQRLKVYEEIEEYSKKLRDDIGEDPPLTLVVNKIARKHRMAEKTLYRAYWKWKFRLYVKSKKI